MEVAHFSLFANVNFASIFCLKLTFYHVPQNSILLCQKVQLYSGPVGGQVLTEIRNYFIDLIVFV
ncbi:hypothetical protein CLV95_108149 [Leptospira borgpetersenii serovar Javanica]|nr:hypothetical protein CLV95_108149 [Leptospira borgpetersenii serovar Javanica]